MKAEFGSDASISQEIPKSSRKRQRTESPSQSLEGNKLADMWSCTSGLQIWETINFCCLRHPVCHTLLGSHSKLIHYLSQVIKVNFNSNKSCWWYVPLWGDVMEMATSTLVFNSSLPPKHHNHSQISIVIVGQSVKYLISMYHNCRRR